MARADLSVCLLLICMTDGQSTSSDRRCVYTFNVPEKDCAQSPGPRVDDKVWKNSIIALQEQVRQLISDNRKLADDVRNLKKERPDSDTGGAVYIRWGRTSCPGNDTTLVYSGVAGGTHYSHTGGGANYLCLPRDPEWGEKNTAGFRTSSSLLYGAEYQMDKTNYFSTQSLHDNNVPCAACLLTNRPTQLMIPAKVACPPGWTKEYFGYLMAERGIHSSAKTYVCMDYAPEVTQSGAANENGALFYNVEAKCGSLPCPNYKESWDITCVVCSK